RDWRVRRDADDRLAVTSEDVIERADELAGAVADQEPSRAVVTHRQMSGFTMRKRATRRSSQRTNRADHASAKPQVNWPGRAFGTHRLRCFAFWGSSRRRAWDCRERRWVRRC